jgi:hypothetical protein
MINDDLTKKLAEAAKKVLANDNTNDKSDDGEGLDKVQPKAVKKKFDDRKDKDIDNDGDVDSSDKYLHKRRKAISKSTKEEVELDEATELYKKGKITLTKFAMGKGKGVGLQINYGMKFIQIPEKDIKQLYTAMVYVTKSVPQFKESVEIEEGFYYDSMSAKDKKRLNSIYKEMDKNEKETKAAIKKGDAKKVDKLGSEYHKLRMQVVNFYNESVEVEESVELEEEKTVADYNELIKKHTDAYKNANPKDRQKHSDLIHKYKKARMNVGKTDGGAPKASGEDPEKVKAARLASIKKALAKESVELEEASKDWEVVVTMGVNKLKKGQKTVVKARNSAEAIKKAAKEFNINDKLITGKVDANLKEEVELQEGRFDKLEKKLGRINPESLEAVMSGKIKLNPAEKKEFDEFMKGVRKMFASTNY